jgi:hypothetical protein
MKIQNVTEGAMAHVLPQVLIFFAESKKKTCLMGHKALLSIQ